MALSEQDWQIRLFIYQHFVDHTRPPTVEVSAAHFGLSPQEMRQAYHRLHDHHTIFLDPGTDNVRMANPLSAIPTNYRVQVNGKSLWANCAWDSLGIPAMLQADAQIEATIALTGETVNYQIQDGKLVGDSGFVHFPLPFHRWYDDLVDT